MNSSEKSILFVLDGGFDGGGAERVASRLINIWVKAGIRVTVVSLSNERDDFYELPSQVNRVFLGKIANAGNSFAKLAVHFSSLWKLRKTIRQNQADVVLSFLTRTNIRTIVASMGLGKRVVISERNDPSKQHYKPIWKILRHLLYRRAAVVTANTKNAVEYMKSYVPDNKLVYIHNPILLPLQQATADRSQIILNVGRLVPQKAQALLFEAFARLNNADWRTHILGDGPEEQVLLSKAKSLNIENNISLKGFIKDTGRHYLEAGIFVLTSEYEGMSNALLEAMSFGVPCVVSDALPGALEHVSHGKTGFVFEGGNAGDLAKKLETLMASPELRKKMGSEGRIRMGQFSPEKVMQAWNEVLFPEF